MGEIGPWTNGKGDRYSPRSEWAFGKGFYGPPDTRRSRRFPNLTNDQVRMWLPHEYRPGQAQ